MAKELLNEYLGDNTSRFIDIIKTCLKEDTPPQKIILFGTGANGKTTLRRMIENTFTDVFDIKHEYGYDDRKSVIDKHTIYETNYLPSFLGENTHLFFFTYRYVSRKPYNKFEKRQKSIDITQCEEVFA